MLVINPNINGVDDIHIYIYWDAVNWYTEFLPYKCIHVLLIEICIDVPVYF